MVMLGTHRDVFATNLSELGCTELHPHRIETGDAQPVRQRFYRQSPAVKGEASIHTFQKISYSYTDASQIAIGYILGQKDHKGKEQVIAYGGRSLRGAEKNYCIRDLEYLALVEGVKQYHVYLASRKFTIFTDHEALLHTQKLRRREKSQADLQDGMFLQSYDYEIIYKKERLMVMLMLIGLQYIRDQKDEKPVATDLKQIVLARGTIKTIAEKPRTYIAANQLDWPDKLSSIAHAMNTSVCTESTQYTPYYMVFSRECRTPIDTVLTTPLNVGPDARLFIDGLHSNVVLAREIAKENSLEAQKKYKAQHDKNAREATFKIRVKVWMDTKTTPVGYSRKLCNKWQGPYYITEVTGKNTYKLRRCSGDVPIKGPVNANRLKTISRSTR
ncbi:Hypothetical predicted protein [Mytilus galloprovincialis]|uniref:Reverse transcriptase RNase H-like domain-containing protein n=1 Tax=Mytilus galloprovincialis TaxID=29158 RepID=A0A8B6D7L1_MYTGA|nr:Hypothetical predicted protein [Mytilus galloprovincialis]